MIGATKIVKKQENVSRLLEGFSHRLMEKRRKSEDSNALKGEKV